MDTDIVEIYDRFVQMRTNHSGIYLYPGYERDLGELLAYLEPYIDDLKDLRRIYERITD